MDKDSWSRPMWNAYVVAGSTRDERKQRLAEVPEEWHADVKRHAQMYYAIRKFYSRKRIK